MKQVSDLRVLIDRIPFAEGNIGEEAILTSLLQDLESFGVNQISVLSNQPERTRIRHGKRVRVIPDEPARWLSLPAEVRRFDLLIWGGGHMLQDRSSQLYIPYVVKTLLLARFWGVPRFIYAPGLGPVVNQFGRFLSRLALKGCRGTVVRDAGSADFLESIGIRQGVSRTADPGFSLWTPADDGSQKAESETLTIGFAPRRLFYRKGSVLPMSWQLASQSQRIPRFESFLEDAAAALDLLIEKRKVQIRLIPMDVGPNPRDDLICRRLRRYMVHGYAVRAFDDDPSLFEFVRRLGELDLLVSARLHGIILGLRFGLPFIGIDSDGKIAQLATSIGRDDCIIKDVDFNRDSFYELAGNVLDRRRELRDELLRTGAELRSRAEENRRLLGECLNGIVQEQ